MGEERKNRKKEKEVSVRLPKASKMVSRKRNIKKAEANYQDFWAFVGTGLIILVIVFFLLGGVNQRKLINTIKDIGVTIEHKVSSLIHPENIEVTDDGVYYVPDGGQDE